MKFIKNAELWDDYKEELRRKGNFKISSTMIYEIFCDTYADDDGVRVVPLKTAKQNFEFSCNAAGAIVRYSNLEDAVHVIFNSEIDE